MNKLNQWKLAGTDHCWQSDARRPWGGSGTKLVCVLQKFPFMCDGFVSKLRLRCRATHKPDLKHAAFLLLFLCKSPVSLEIPVCVMVVWAFVCKFVCKESYYVQSQGVIEVRRHLWRSSSPAPLLKQGQPELVAQNKGWRLHNLSGSLVKHLQYAKVWEVNVQMEFAV